MILEQTIKQCLAIKPKNDNCPILFLVCFETSKERNSKVSVEKAMMIILENVIC